MEKGVERNGLWIVQHKHKKAISPLPDAIINEIEKDVSMIRSVLKALVTPHDKFAPAFVCKRRQTKAQMEYRVWKSMQ